MSTTAPRTIVPTAPAGTPVNGYGITTPAPRRAPIGQTVRAASRLPRPAPRGTADGYGVAPAMVVNSTDGRAVAVEPFPMNPTDPTALARLQSVADEAIAAAPSQRDVTRATARRAPMPVPRTYANGDRTTNDTAWAVLAPYITGERASVTVRARLVKMAGENGYSAPEGRLFASGMDLDDITSTAVLKALDTVRALIAREDVRPAVVTGYGRPVKVTRAPGQSAPWDHPVTYSDRDESCMGWYAPRERACLECQRCTLAPRKVKRQGQETIIVGRDPLRTVWSLDGCEAPVVALDYVTPGKAWARAVYSTVQAAFKRSATVGTGALSPLAAEITGARPSLDAPATLMDGASMGPRMRAVVAAVALRAAAEGVEPVGPQGQISGAVALMLAEEMGRSGSLRSARHATADARRVIRLARTVVNGTGDPYARR